MVARKLPESLGEWVVSAWDRKAVGALLAAANRAAAGWRAAAAQVRAALAIPAEGRHDPDVLAFAAAEEKAEAWRTNLGKLPSYVSYWRLHPAVSRGRPAQLAAPGPESARPPGRKALA